METLLMIVTLVSLALAVGMSVLAWRLLREDRRRAAARADVLEAMAAESDAPTSGTRHSVQGTGEISFTDDDANVEVRPRVSTDDGFVRKVVAVGSQSPDGRLEDWDFRRQHASGPSDDTMFGAVVQRPASSGRWLALAAVGILMACGIGAVYTIYRPAAEAGSSSSTEMTAVHTGDPHPLELLSLRHSTDPDGAFTVTGLVQNPYGGQAVHKVVAVVYLFDRDGNYFAGGKAALDFTALQPGDESPFVVHMPNAGRVSRYRVGFRMEDGGVVVHVDRRGQLPGSTTGDTIDGAAGMHRSVSPVSAPRRSAGRP